MRNDKEGFENILSKEQVAKLINVNKDDLVDDTYIDSLIDKLDEDAIFNSIFKIQ